jgi:hypothetical protein
VLYKPWDLDGRESRPPLGAWHRRRCSSPLSEEDLAATVDGSVPDLPFRSAPFALPLLATTAPLRFAFHRHEHDSHDRRVCDTCRGECACG